MKIGRTGEKIKNISLEYESCKEIAAKQGISLKEVYDEARNSAQKALLEKEET